jgi:diguanylate cyclase (GGDEF)-like protein/PAS domain S-box-containing protein
MVQPTINAEHLYAEQVRQLYRLSRVAYVGTLISSSILVFALWGLVSSTPLGGWFCAMFAVTAARYLLYRSYQRLQPPASEARSWARRFVIGAGAAGLLWGIAGSLLFPVSSLLHQFLLIFLVGGIALAAMVVLAPVPQACYAFVLPALLLTTASVFSQDTSLHAYMGLLMVVFIAVIMATVLIVSGMMRDSLGMKFENSALVEQLSQANRELSENVAALRRSQEELRQNEQRYRYMFEANPVPMWIRDEETLMILAANDAALAAYRYSRAEFLRLKSSDLQLAGEADGSANTARSRDSRQGSTSHWRHRRQDGSVMDVETISHHFDLGGRPARLTLVNDVTHRMRAERHRNVETAVIMLLAYGHSIEEVMPRVIQSLCDGLGYAYGARWTLDGKQQVLRCAESWSVHEPKVEEFRRISSQRLESPGKPGGVNRQVWATSAPVWVADVADDLTLQRRDAALQAGLNSAFAFPILVGGEFYGLMEFFAREPRHRDEQVLGLVQTVGIQIGQFIARKQAEVNLQFFASHDPLTGLFNRGMFNDRLQQAIAQAARFERSLALLFIDLDGFKLVNDTLGHNAGDALLAELAARLRGTLREGDVIGRLGGDEFVVLIEEFAEVGQVAEVAKKMLETVSRPFVLQSREFEVTASLGISIYPDDGKDAQMLLKNADMAMYLVKQQGKNNFRFYSSQINVPLVERLSLETSLRRALERGELQLAYQPRVGVRDGQVSGVEALVRWQHPTQGTINPGEFVPLAEDAGLMLTIGEWVLHSACRQLRDWRDQGLPLLRMAVNVSPRQFAQDSLIQVVREALHNTGIDPARLELEIREEMVLRNTERAVRVLNQFKELGVRLVIDDFGTGYSSLNVLRRLPVDSVKIDRSLILELPRGADAAALTRGVVAMAHSLGIAVTAEGVETREQWEFLNQLACEEMQGNYFSAPVAPEIVASIVRQPVAGGQRAAVQALRPRRSESGADPD